MWVSVGLVMYAKSHAPDLTTLCLHHQPPHTHHRLDLPLYESREELAAALQLVCSMEDMATGFTID